MKKIFGACLKYIRQTDRLLILVSLAAGLYGLILIVSATHGFTRFALTQLIGIIIGFVGMIVLSKIDYHELTELWKIFAVAAIVLLFLPYINPHTVKGSEDLSWLKIGSITVQPAEFVKILFIFTFAKHLDMVKDEIHSAKKVLLLCLHAAVPIGIITFEKDMGMALVFALIFVSMMFAGNVQLRYFAAAGVAVLSGAPVLWNLKVFAMQRKRIMALFDPTNPLYSQYADQQNQSVSAIGSGEFWGYGLFHGPKTQSSLTSGLLPERQNDMIFAVAGEELGFIGCVIVLILFITLLSRIIRDARVSKDFLGSMLCVGVFASFSVQMIINLGMVLRVLPVIGITLPFFSSGGSAVLSAFLAIGIVLSVHMHRKSTLFTQQESE